MVCLDVKGKRDNRIIAIIGNSGVFIKSSNRKWKKKTVSFQKKHVCFYMYYGNGEYVFFYMKIRKRIVLRKKCKT